VMKDYKLKQRNLRASHQIVKKSGIGLGGKSVFDGIV